MPNSCHKWGKQMMSKSRNNAETMFRVSGVVAQARGQAHTGGAKVFIPYPERQYLS